VKHEFDAWYNEMKPGVKFFKSFLCCALVGVASLVGCATHTEPARYPYHQPLSSPGEKFGGLPPAVQKTVRAQVGSADMYDIRKLDASSDRVVYEILFHDRNRYPPLYVASDGSVLYPDMTVAVPAEESNIGALSGGAAGGVKFSDLPIGVAHTVLEKEPTAEVAFIHRVYLGGSPFYEVTFKNAKRYQKLLIAEDGAVVNETPVR
jgi:hypothetical protein